MIPIDRKREGTFEIDIPKMRWADRLEPIRIVAIRRRHAALTLICADQVF